MAAALHAWHPGEVAVQRRLGFADAVSHRWRNITNYMPEQHRLFHTHNLHFIPITTIDAHGRPWASIVAGPTGDIGFVKSPNHQALSITARLWDGDPLGDTAAAWIAREPPDVDASERFLTAGLGIEFSTRRRNKFAGRIEDVSQAGNSCIQFDINVNEALGNCPKYINVYQLVPFASPRPQVVHRTEHLQKPQRLPQEVIDFILNADTVFVGSIYKSQQSATSQFPSHAGMNARSGLPGFIRVSPSDGQTIVLPDYSGNRFVSSLGNIEATGLAGFTIVSFTTGDVLYLTGTAVNLVGPDALKIMRRHAAITVMKVTGFTFVKDALPFRQQTGIPVERSPYSPRIRYLVEEPGPESDQTKTCKAELKSVTQLSDDLAVFTFSLLPPGDGRKLRIRPGQAIALDFMNWIGPPQYQHMSDTKPSLLNDDRVRTWTVSRVDQTDDVSWFELTMREVEGGTVTGALFDIVRGSKKAYGSPFRPTKTIVAEVVGITGDFCLSGERVNALWIAGGIGITPFLAMLNALVTRETPIHGDIRLAFATREPGVMIGLLRKLLERLPSEIRITIDIFTHVQDCHLSLPHREGQKWSVRRGRIPAEYWTQAAAYEDVFICGPGGFGDSAMEGLKAAGVPLQRIQREGFY